MLKKLFMFLLAIVLIVGIIIGYIFIYREEEKLENNINTHTTEIFNIEQDNRIQADFYMKQMWTDGNFKSTCYTSKFQNKTNRILENWKLEIEVPEDTKLEEFWGVKCELKENVLTIIPEDYNKEVEAYSEKDFGMILSSWNAIIIKEYTLYVNDDLYEGEKPIYPAKGTPLYEHGRLTVAGPNIIDKNGEPYILQGVSTHGIAWYPEYITKETFKSVRDDLHCNAIRIAIYSDDKAGYSKELHSLMSDGIDSATELGLYVIIDWAILDDNNPNQNKDKAIEFFEEMASEFKNYDNIIYEICNEPNGNVTWEDDIKPYAEDLITKIRDIDEDGIIVVGTPNFSQDVDIVALDKLEGYSNIVYAFHFYSATHKADFRQKLQYALDVDMPILVTEFGTCEADGDGKVDLKESDKWIKYLRDNKIGYFCWNLTNKEESSSLLKTTTSNVSDWNDDELSDSGLWLKNKYTEINE